MGIGEALARRPALREEKRTHQTAVDARVHEIAEYINAISIVYAMEVQGFVPQLPTGVDA